MTSSYKATERVTRVKPTDNVSERYVESEELLAAIFRVREVNRNLSTKLKDPLITLHPHDFPDMTQLKDDLRYYLIRYSFALLIINNKQSTKLGETSISDRLGGGLPTTWSDSILTLFDPPKSAQDIESDENHTTSFVQNQLDAILSILEVNRKQYIILKEQLLTSSDLSHITQYEEDENKYLSMCLFPLLAINKIHSMKLGEPSMMDQIDSKLPVDWEGAMLTLFDNSERRTDPARTDTARTDPARTDTARIVRASYM
jgi:hypothetical protein